MEKACRVALSVNLQPTDPSALGALQKCLAVSKKAWCGAYCFSICWDWSVAVFHSLFFFILDHVKVSTQELHTILYVDCTKLGVLNQSEINMVGSVAEKVLSQNPSRPLDHWLALQYAWSNFACCKNINAKYSILQIHAYSHKKKQIWGSVLVLIHRSLWELKLVDAFATISGLGGVKWAWKIGTSLFFLESWIYSWNRIHPPARKLEDKLSAVRVELRHFTLNLNVDDLHKNRESPSAFVCFLGVLDSTLPLKGTAYRKVRGAPEAEMSTNEFLIL